MNNTLKRLTPFASALVGMGCLIVAGPAAAIDYWLCAKSGTITLPGATVPIWGYVKDNDNNLSNGCPAALNAATWTAAMPALTVPSSDPGLTVHLRNDLTQEPTSLVIAGQSMPTQIVGQEPVWIDPPGTGPRTALTQRVRSFTHEAAPGGGIADYVWPTIKPGTYLYHSGTHPQVQVQMGLYGAVVKNFLDPVFPVPGRAYNGVPYDNEVTLLFSEIDPAQHAAINAGTFGTGSAPDTPCPDLSGTALPMTSTLCYRPKYYLINGKPFQAGVSAPLAELSVGENTLLRMLNAGLRSYVPTLLGTDMKLIAEDGNRYQYRVGNTFHARDQYQYSTLLASLKTTDVIIVPPAEGTIPVYDRRLHLVNNQAQDGGMFGKLNVVCLVGSCTDLSITKDDGLTSVNPGDPVNYTIVVSNAGPTDVTGATVTDTLPVDLTGATWACAATSSATFTSSCTPTGSGDIADTINLAVGGTATYTVTGGTFSATATGNLVNTASVAAPAGVTDKNPADNSATDTDTIILPVDLTITKTDGADTVAPGAQVIYTIVVSNVGTNDVTGATVTDTMPAALSAMSWSCTAGSCGTASGIGSINTAVDLAAAGGSDSATYTVTGTVSPSATGTLVNTASVAGPGQEQNSATDTDSIVRTADLSITKTNGATAVAPGSQVIYTIVVSNNAGPNDVTGATVTDTMPAALSAMSWSCTGSCGATSGTGSIDDTIDLAVSGSATYTVIGTVSPSATGLVNTASVAVPGDVTDTDSNNNAATDTDTVLPLKAYFSTAGDTAVPGVTGTPDDADIYAWYSNADGTVNGYSRVFDASVFGVPTVSAANVDAFVYNGPADIYLSFSTASVILPGIGAVQDEDIVRWTGTWTVYFNGTGVGLNATGATENVDAFAFNGNDLLVSTQGNPDVVGVADEADEDLLSCNGGSRGAVTTCNSWSMYFDGSDVGLSNGGNPEDVDFAKRVGTNDLYLSTFGNFTTYNPPLAPPALTGTGNQVFSCNGGSRGATTTCPSFSNVLLLPAVPAKDAISLP